MKKSFFALFLSLFIAVEANATINLWCSWMLHSNENPFERVDMEKIKLTDKERSTALELVGSDFRNLLEKADDVHYFTFNIIVDKKVRSKYVKALDDLGINRIVTNSWIGKPNHRWDREKVTIKEKNVDVILYTMSLARKFDLNPKVTINTHAVSREFASETLLHEQNVKLYEGLADDEQVEFFVYMRWSKPHFKQIVKEIKEYPGLDITDADFNRLQPTGSMTIKGSKKDMEKVFESGYVEIMQLENRGELCLKYPQLCQ